MAQRLIQTQEQKQQQVQRLTARQLLQVRLLEMPLTELEESVKAELDDNPALETAATDDALGDDRMESTEGSEENFEEQQEREEREDALDAALEGIGRDDEMPFATSQSDYQGAEYEEMVYGDTVSFYDKIKEQAGELDLSPQQNEIMDYLIGSLDDDGLLRKPVDDIVDELAIHHYIDTTEAEVGEVLAMLQGFDPPGIGAQSLQECLLLQLKRQPESHTRQLAQDVISRHYDAFRKKNWARIQQQMHLSEVQMADVVAEIRKLNPKPGAALGETMGRNVQQITPDFIVDTADDGTVTFSLNRGQIPELKVSPSFVDMVDTYKNNKKSMSRSEKEALLYAKEKMEKAQAYIDAIRQRRQTLYVTMRAIINWQHRFFQEGDEADLRPMILKDIAEKTGLDISTISRVSNVKYAQTKWGTFPLRYFFSDSYTTSEGEELSTRKIKAALREIIDEEDKKAPYSDEVLTMKMKEKGLAVARRTIAKYREQLGIPVARLRKE
ncbi:MAG: RNA polymerase factor sigma-54 [Prevotella sp.]|nr:RNA polymerase factor sigma-54 [Prevotella sp.]